jgi:Zn-dependent peptidase ImmA (M78 family)
MSTLERGFKAWAERTAAGIRRDLDLSSTEPLEPRKLAEHLDVRLVSPEQLAGLPADILRQLLEVDPWGWSATTLVLPSTTVVIYNPKKSKGRQASDIIHELAHIILGHEPSTVVFSEDGQLATRTFDQTQEDEANWLGWAMLLPREALMSARRARLPAAQVADLYGVTEQLVTFRLRMTGVEVQMRRDRSVRGA